MSDHGPQHRDGVRPLRRFAAALGEPIVALLVPGREVPRQVLAGRYGVAMLVVVLCSLVAAFAIGMRYSATAAVFEEMDRAERLASPGDDQATAEPKTDREIAEEIEQKTAVVRVMLGLKAGLGTPALVLALGIGLFGLGRFVGGDSTFRRALSASALAFLPGAIRNLIAGAAAWRQDSIVESDFDSLVVNVSTFLPKTNSALYRLVGGIDLFTLWAIVIVVLGLSTSANISRRKSSVVIIIAFALYLVVTQLIAGGPAVPGDVHQ